MFIYPLIIITLTDVSNTSFLESITELDGFISAQSFDILLICGDFNVDFARRNNDCNLLFDLITLSELA